LSGNEAYVVARYEYTPGFDQLDAVAAGARAITGQRPRRLRPDRQPNKEGDADSNLGAADMTCG
jgi:hypothetical protein